MSPAEALNLLHNSQEIVSSKNIFFTIEKLGQSITSLVKEDFPLVLSVMGGAIVFTGLLLPKLGFPLDFNYIHLSRYNNNYKGKDKEIEWRIAPDKSVQNRTVLVLDDILDEGKTLALIKEKILSLGAHNCFTAVLCEKYKLYVKPLQPDFVGIQVPDQYVFGCGMDIKGYWRNLPTINSIDFSKLEKF